jgi:xylulokinase
MVGGSADAPMTAGRRGSDHTRVEGARVSDAVVIGIDIGTTNSKAVACRGDGTVLAEASVAHGVDRPAPEEAEHDAEAVWWGDTVTLARALMAGLGPGAPVRGLAVTTCGPCIVPVDRAGRALRRGILYGVDSRATQEIRELEGALGRAAIRAHGDMDLTSQSIGPKVAWLARHEPDVVARTATWHTATSFVVARLTGVAVIDHHQAAYFGPVIDARARAWDLAPVRAHASLLAAALDGRLPPLRWPGDLAGALTAGAAAATDLPVGTPVLVGTSDGPTEALGVGAIRPGIVALTLGSTTTLTTFADPPATTDHGLWRSAGWSPDEGCIGAGLAASGAVIDWLAATLGLDVAASEAEAFASPPGARGLLVLPYLAGIRTPAADPEARGLIAGLSLAHTRGDLVRAVHEGLGYAVRRDVEAFSAAGVVIDTIRASGGGTRSTLAVQTLADILDRPIEVASQVHGAAYGAAYLAARSTGVLATAPRGGAEVDWFRPATMVWPNPGTVAMHEQGFARFCRLVAATGGQR